MRNTMNERYYPYYKFFMDIKNNLDWANIIKIVPIDEEVLSNILPLVDLNTICQYQILSEKFLVDHLDKLDWDSISSFQPLSMEFINRYISHINLKKIANSNNKLSLVFLNEYKDKLDWTQVSKCQKLDSSELLAFKDRIDWPVAFKFQNISMETLEKIISSGSIVINWGAISEHQRLTEDFIVKYDKLLNMDKVFKFQTLTDAFRKKYNAPVVEKDVPIIPLVPAKEINKPSSDVDSRPSEKTENPKTQNEGSTTTIPQDSHKNEPEEHKEENSHVSEPPVHSEVNTGSPEKKEDVVVPPVASGGDESNKASSEDNTVHKNEEEHREVDSSHTTEDTSHNADTHTSETHTETRQDPPVERREEGHSPSSEDPGTTVGNSETNVPSPGLVPGGLSEASGSSGINREDSGLLPTPGRREIEVETASGV